MNWNKLEIHYHYFSTLLIIADKRKMQLISQYNVRNILYINILFYIKSKLFQNNCTKATEPLFDFNCCEISAKTKQNFRLVFSDEVGFHWIKVITN